MTGIGSPGFGMLGKRRLGVLFVLVFAAGCPRVKETLIPVAGTIAVNGQPLASGTVVFHPDPEKGNKDRREFRATIAGDLSGGYRLTTGKQDGAPAGWYKVAVYALEPPTSSERPPKWLASQKYADAKTSELSVEVAKDAPAGNYDFKLDSPR